MGCISPLRDFVQTFTKLIDSAGDDENLIFVEGKKLLSDLITCDDWLAEEFTHSDPTRYSQYLLHCDPLERF